MNETTKRLFAAGILTGFTILGIGGAAMAAATDMNVNVSGGAGSTVVPNAMKPAVQGTQDSDGDQDAWLKGPITMAVPQLTAPSK